MAAEQLTLPFPHIQEIWKRIPLRGFGNLYEASSWGRVRRAFKYGRRFDHVLHPSKTQFGYLKVTLISKPKRKTLMVHQLIALAFIGPRVKGMLVHHKDGDKTNNVPDNLEYLTIAEHALVSDALGQRLRGNQLPWTKLTPKEVCEIQLALNTDETLASIAKRYGVTPSNVGCIARGVHWKHIAKPINRNRQIAKGERSSKAKLTTKQVLEIREALKNGEAQKVLAQRYGVHSSVISLINLRKTWKHI